MPSRWSRGVPRDHAGRFVNWSRTRIGTPATWHLPTSEDEVRAVVASAAAAGRRLRVVGAGHSFSAIAVPDGDAMSLEALHAPLRVDRERQQVSAPAGMRLRDLSDTLARDGLELPIVGSIQSQSVAGVVATGTHGSSLRHGNLASLVTGMRVVTGSGDVVVLDGDDERLAGARVHLGALGVVTEVTLRVRPATRLHQRIEQVPIADAVAALPDIANSAEYVKVWWLPHTAHAQVVRYDATDEPPTRWPSARTRRRIDDHLMHGAVFPLIVRLQHRAPAATARINRALVRTYLGPASQIGAGPLMLNTTMPVRHRETEAALPLARAADAVTRIVECFREGRPAVNFPLEVRFVRGDDAWMSPAYGADTCQIGAYITDCPDCPVYFEKFWEAVRPFDPRPHWGKEFDHDAAYLRAAYPRFDSFLRLREQWDPGHVFAGPLLDRILGT